LIKTPEGNLSRFMRQVDGLYTQNYQRLRKSRGSVFRSRYKAVLVQAEKYLLNLSRFLHCLPGRNRIKPETHPWSRYAPSSNNARPGDWLVRDEVLAQLGEGGRVHVRYASYVAEGADQELAHFYGKKNLLSILGDDKFRKQAMEKVAPASLRGISKGALAR